jgi:hypothetical protein
MQSKLYNCSIRGKNARNTLAKENGKKDERIYAHFARLQISIAPKLYATLLPVPIQQESIVRAIYPSCESSDVEACTPT